MNVNQPKKILYNKAMGIIPFIVLFVGLSVTFLGWQYIRDVATATARDQFNGEVNQIEYILSRRIRTYNDILYAFQGFFSASESVERHEWNSFVETARFSDYPDVAYISYIEIVNDVDKEAFIENFRSDTSTNPAGYPDLIIFPEETRDVYAVAKFIYPENIESSNAYGFDLYSSPPRKVALDKAADINKPVASEVISLATDGSSGFLIAAPVYVNGKPVNTIEEKRAALRGFVAISFKTANLFTNIFSADDHLNVTFTIYDGDDVLYTSKYKDVSNNDARPHRYMETKELEIGGRTWVLEVVSKPSFADSFSERDTPAIVGIGGIALTVLLFLTIYYYGKRANQLIQLQSAALDAAANSVVITDIKGIIQWVNPAYTILTGYESNEVVGKSTRILNSGKQDKEFYRHLWETILAGKIWKGELTNKRKDGTLYQEEQIISPVTDKSGKVTNFIAVKQDITLRKKLEETVLSANRELEESKKAITNVLEDLNIEKENLKQENIKDAAIFASIGEGLIVTDKSGKILMVNDAFEKLTGWSRSDVTGKDMIEVVPKYDEHNELIPKEKRSLTKVLAGKTRKGNVSTLTTTHYYMRRDKTKLFIIGTVTPIIINGTVTGAVQVFRDVSVEKEIDKMKDEFVSIASHELRTPLTAIDGITSMLRDGEYGEISDNLKQPLADINSSSERLIHLVNDLLNLSRMQVGRQKYTLSTFEISDRIQEVAGLFEALAKEKGIRLTVDVLVKAKVHADAGKVQQLCNNLLSNALKFTDKGTITLTTKDAGDKIEVYISDTGISISKEDQPKLFGKFQQLTTAQGRPPGTGLGLHISREIARKMGGDVWLEKSEAGKGSTFVFSLPKAETDLAKKTEQEIEQEANAHPDQKTN